MTATVTPDDIEVHLEEPIVSFSEKYVDGRSLNLHDSLAF